ncbi:MAG: hypothetical protein L0Z63_10860 [Actinobacteria bacterium]|nr:hypothetical protein [Actinomycetota bacterium]
MVLDPEYPGGRAILVPCKRELDRFEDLLHEAEALWMAERNAEASAGISASWGCVGALFGPNVPGSLGEEWAVNFPAKAAEHLPIDERGQLLIDWPTRRSDNTRLDLDVILATATVPEQTRPTAENIARAWTDQSNGEERYFIENVRHGIRTPDDYAIWCHLEERHPPWLDQEVHHQLGDHLARSRPGLPMTAADSELEVLRSAMRDVQISIADV